MVRLHARACRASSAAARRAPSSASSFVARVASVSLPSPSTVTRFSGSGRSSVESQKSIACLRDLLERPLRRELRLARLLAAEHRRLRLADHLDVPERVVELVAGEVEVVQPERLLEDGRVLLAREREHGLAVVEHVVAADLVGAVREAVRVLVVRRDEQQLGGVRRAAGEDDEVGRVASPSRRRARRRRSVTAVPASFVSSLTTCAFVSSVDVRVLERRPHAEHLGVRLAVHGAREAVAVRAADARAVRHVRLVQPDPARRVERVVARPPRGRPRAAGSAARARPPGTGTARSRAARSGPRRGRRAPRSSCSAFV